MIESASRFTLFAMYQFVVVVGLLLLPVALFARRFGVVLPIGDLIEATEAAYEQTAE